MVTDKLPVLLLVAALAFVSACVVADLRSRRIPNALTGAGFAVGIASNAFYGGSAGALSSLLAALAVGLVLLAPFALGGIGAGDVKMMAAVAALLGPRAGFAALLLGMVFGGIIMIGHLARLGRLGEKLLATARMFLLAVSARSVDPLRVSAAQPSAIALPYSVPLALGTAAVAIACMTLGRLVP
jgi:prepilin peptidase CpaA